MAQAPAKSPSSRSRKTKALLAGGLVLGIGAAVTLAAWTDDEWVQGIFGAGSFNVEGSADGETYADHAAEGDAADLQFSANFDNLAPGDTVAAPFNVRLDEATTYDADVTLANASATGNLTAALSYRLAQVADFGSCTAEPTGTELVTAGTGLGTAPDAAQFDLTAGGEGAAGEAVTLCFQITAGDEADMPQGGTATATWQFSAESVDPAGA